MANYYVYSGATGGGTGADWANAYTTLTAAIAGKAAGDTFYVAHDHNESTGAAVTLAFFSTTSNPQRVICVNRSGSVPPVSADLRNTGRVVTTGAFAISITGPVYCYGMILLSGSASSSTPLNVTANSYFENCILGTASIMNTATCVQIPGGGARMIMHNCQIRATMQGQVMFTGAGYLVWRNYDGRAAWDAGSIMSSIVAPVIVASSAGRFYFEGIDFSASSAMVSLCATASGGVNAVVKDCKFGSGFGTLGSHASGNDHAQFTLIRSNGATSPSRIEHVNYRGKLTTETTIVMTGGANDGNVPISWKLVTASVTAYGFPFELWMPINVWIDAIGAPKTISLEGTWGTAGTPNNDDIYMDVEYLGAGDFPLGSVASNARANPLAATTNHAAGTGTWSGGTTPFKMSVTITPQMKGFVSIYLKSRRNSATFYIDPKPVIT